MQKNIVSLPSLALQCSSEMSVCVARGDDGSRASLSEILIYYVSHTIWEMEKSTADMLCDCNPLLLMSVLYYLQLCLRAAHLHVLYTSIDI